MQILFLCSVGFSFSILISFADSFSWRVLNAFYRPSRKKIKKKWYYIFSTRSFCESCRSDIRIIYLIPILGSLLTSFRCYNCYNSISKRFFWEECLAFFYGCLFAYFHSKQNYTLNLSQDFLFGYYPFYKINSQFSYLIFSMAYFFIGYLIILIDFEFFLIPTEAILYFISLGLLETYFFSHMFYINLMIACFWMSLFWLIRILSRYKMGFADVMLIFALSLSLFYPQQFSLPTLASLFGIGFYLIKKIKGKNKKIKIKLPFGSFLVIAFLVLRLLPKSIFHIIK